ncbi:MAG: T9SS type A sorting domain-containing protein [Bacteroidota bacterium]
MSLRNRIFSALAVLLLIPGLVTAQNVVPVTDADISENTLWTSDNVYVLQGRVFVEDGETLTIQPGTVIQGAPGEGEEASVLVVARGGKIFAEGTAANPIIFTAEGDDGTLTADDRGEWGGVIILGNAPTNLPGNEGAIEGIPTTETRGLYGGDDPDDNSGVFRYVSIRHGGVSIGADNEINGLTLGGVGAGTVVEFVEVFANLDDGFEWFGGTVNGRYLASVFVGDENFDTDQGYSGNNQFLFAINSEDAGDWGTENDGGDADLGETLEPFATSKFVNVTMIGSGAGGANTGQDGAFRIRENSRVSYVNSIVTEFNGIGIAVQDRETGADSREGLEDGTIMFGGNTWWNFLSEAGTVTNDPAEFIIEDYVRDYLTAPEQITSISNPMLRSISRTDDGTLDPRPMPESAVWTDGTIDLADAFFTSVPYRGAFGTSNWLRNWTALEEKGYFPAAGEGAEIRVTDADIGDQNFWTADNTYILDGRVFVEDGEELYIEAGTVIQGAPGEGEDASVLVVARGGKIFAEGTASDPIIFTAEGDDGTLTADDRGEWGGVIILGRAGTNLPNNEGAIEGIPTTETRGLYGGDDDADNSGIFRYVSIRHGGVSIGADNEINGLTLGGVGTGTTIEFVEVFANLDDGFEWFGGTVNGRYLISAFVGDENFDTDQGYRGNNQFLFAINSEDAGDWGTENDGGDADLGETLEPFATSKFVNVTMIGSGAGGANTGQDGAFRIRENSRVSYINSIVTEFNGIGIAVQDRETGADSREGLEDGTIMFANNVWWNFVDEAGNVSNDITAIAPEDYVQTYLANNNNVIGNPMLRSINRFDEAALDPRPMPGSPAYTVAQPVDGEFFTATDYAGAFDQTIWANGWTALSSQGYLVDPQTVDTEDDIAGVPAGFVLEQNYPNPFNPTTSIRFSVDGPQDVRLAVYDVTGREVAVLIDGQRAAGTYNVTFDANTLPSGLYLYRLDAGAGSVVKKMMLVK